jgi:hypothetical protein
MKDQFLKGLNFVLMLDLFFVLLCFFWFAIAIVGRATKFPLGLEVWYSLWTPVMQPAIGILMTGALLSGISGWIVKRLEERQS